MVKLGPKHRAGSNSLLTDDTALSSLDTDGLLVDKTRVLAGVLVGQVKRVLGKGLAMTTLDEVLFQEVPSANPSNQASSALNSTPINSGKLNHATGNSRNSQQSCCG